MSFELSKKIILISENVRIITPIRHVLNRVGLEIASEYLNLHSLPAIRKAIARTGNTAFIKADLMRFIKEQGFPYAIIMDVRNDLFLNHGKDPDKMQLLKTLLISYIILKKGKDYENLHGNFILMFSKKGFEDKFHFIDDSHKLLEMLATNNQSINSYIDELKQNIKEFKDYFFIKALDSEMSFDNVSIFVETFLKGVSARQGQTKTVQAAKTEAVVDANPARIIYKIDESLFNDGEIAALSETDYSGIKEKEFYLIGAWSAKTELEVTKKFADIIQKGLSDKKRFNFNEEIIINIDDRCNIDKNTTLSIAQLFTKNLKAYKKFKIIVSKKNGDLITKSRGFPMIKDIVTVNL